jgi:hypothetical protein
MKDTFSHSGIDSEEGLIWLLFAFTCLRCVAAMFFSQCQQGVLVERTTSTVFASTFEHTKHAFVPIAISISLVFYMVLIPRAIFE